MGFDRVGFTDVKEPEEAGKYFEWLSSGMQGSMAYMGRDPAARANPALAHPWARSMIVLASSYYHPLPRGAGRGRIARYALGEDYHRTLKKRARALADAIERRFKSRCKTCVDTSAILERPHARRAGLGWIGKNSLLLNRSMGSFFFLAEILTSLEIPPDRPSTREHCGTCVRCIDRCPTGAIVAPKVVDARRCISYLTIEHRGVIDRELRPLMGNLIYGCDICQEVCPWNRRARRVDPPGFDRELLAPELAPLMRLSREEFRERFKHSPLLRVGRDGFLRNVAIALGNSGSPGAVGPLTIGLNDDSALVRLHSAWALGRLGTPQAIAALEDREKIERDRDVLAEILNRP
jgi:epoxyqueuosine reductase